MDLETKLELLAETLRLPDGHQLKPWLAKLIANPDSVVIISIEKPLGPNGPHIGTAWLSNAERVKVRKALIAINAARSQKRQPTTSEIPHATQEGNIPENR